MAIVGYETLTIIAILVILFIWGPQKLPEMAKSLGQAKREFEKATKEMTSTLTTTTSTSAIPVTPQQDPLIVAAKSLGITTEGKTKEELAKEIAQRTTK